MKRFDCTVCRGKGIEDSQGSDRYSLGIYAARMCDKHWDESGYRKEGREGFDEMDAGESYDSDDWGGDCDFEGLDG